MKEQIIASDLNVVQNDECEKMVKAELLVEDPSEELSKKLIEDNTVK